MLLFKFNVVEIENSKESNVLVEWILKNFMISPTTTEKKIENLKGNLDDRNFEAFKTKKKKKENLNWSFSIYFWFPFIHYVTKFSSLFRFSFSTLQKYLYQVKCREWRKEKC